MKNMESEKQRRLRARYGFNPRSSLGPAMPYVLYGKKDKNQIFPYHVSQESFDSFVDHGCGRCYGRSPWSERWLILYVFRYVIVSFEIVTDPEVIKELNNWLKDYNDEE